MSKYLIYHPKYNIYNEYSTIDFKDNKLVTSGGRVLNICALGNSLEEIRSKIYKAAEIIDFSGKQYRKDIGLM